MKSKIKILLSAALFLFVAVTSFGQGTTTSGMNGRVSDTDGNSLPGATVIAVHTPTGSQFGGITDDKGYYRLPNMNVGGPYKITVTFIGFEAYEKESIYLTLGQTFRLNVTLGESQTVLAEVAVIGRRVQEYDAFDGNRTGAETVIDNEKISEIPSVSRSLSDFTKLTPQVSITSYGGINIAGSNSRYNSFFIDGAINNDVFGLADNGTNGGQIGISPFSIDAIEQLQVVIAPYDVRYGGFAGGGINAVTRMGSNKVEGSAYFFMRNQNLAGTKPTDDETIEKTKLDKFSSNTYGFRLGGPIIKNKLFFFINGEFQREETPQPFDFAEYNGNATRDSLNLLISKLNGYGYNPGAYENVTRSLKSEKFLIKLDYNINRNHKLMFRHQYTKGVSLSPSRSSSSRLRFENGGINFPSTTNSTALELKSNFSSKFSNKLIVGYTMVRDDRDPMGDNFPKVYIDDGGGDIEFGSEEYSTANKLDQNILTITDNFQIYKGKHTITIGTHNEFYKIYNLFVRQNFGVYKFNNVNEFLTDANAYDYFRSYSVVDDVTGDGSKAAADFNAMQLGFYAQDEFQMSDKFKLSFGLRIDIPMFTTELTEDTYFNNTTIASIESYGYSMEGAKAGQMPSPQLMFSPRIGFNWDVSGDKTTQVRGGTGIFTSRIPFVWPGASYSNNGLMVGNVFAGDVPFRHEWDNQYVSTDFDPSATDVPSGDMNLFVKDFKYPQVWRTSLAVDQKLPWGLIATFEGLYTKTLNNVLYHNYNIKPSTQSLTGTPDDRPIYNRRDEVDDTYGYIMVGSNTNKGYTYNLTVQLQKPFDNGFTASLAYTYGHATTVFDGTSSQNSSQWRYMENATGRNYVGQTISDFDLGSRIVGYASYRIEYLNHAATTISLFYNGQSGKRFSYLYHNGNRMTNENSKDMDLIYIPASQGEIIFADAATASQQWSDLDEYIEQDPYLSKHRGEYAERNSSRLPFENIFDLKIIQDIFTNFGERRHTLQFTFDIFNLGNLLNPKWGRMHYANYYENIRLIRFEGFQADGTTPEFSFSRPDNDAPWDIDDGGMRSSRWQAQFGVRYLF